MPKVIRPKVDVLSYEIPNPNNPSGYKITERHVNPTVIVSYITHFRKAIRQGGTPAIEFWFSHDFCSWLFLSEEDRDQAFEEVYAAVSE